MSQRSNLFFTRYPNFSIYVPNGQGLKNSLDFFVQNIHIKIQLIVQKIYYSIKNLYALVVQNIL